MRKIETKQYKVAWGGNDEIERSERGLGSEPDDFAAEIDQGHDRIRGDQVQGQMDKLQVAKTMDEIQHVMDMFHDLNKKIDKALPGRDMTLEEAKSVLQVMKSGINELGFQILEYTE
jgi:hypothetical protein